MRSIDYAECIASLKPGAPKFRVAESTCGKHLRTRCQKTTFGLCGHTCLTTCVAREYAARCNALNGADALSILPPYNSRSSAVAFSLFLACYLLLMQPQLFVYFLPSYLCDGRKTKTSSKFSSSCFLIRFDSHNNILM